MVVADSVLNRTSGNRQDLWWIAPIYQRSRIHLTPPRREAIFVDLTTRPLTTRHWYAGVKGGGDERVAQRVGADVLADPGAAGDARDNPGGAVPVQPPPTG